MFWLTGLLLVALWLGGAATVRGQSPLDGFDPNANGTVNEILLQADGKILIGGFFTTLSPNGGAAVTRNRIARLNADGTLDAAFDPNLNNGVQAMALQPDGKILIGGNFTSLSPNGGAAVTQRRIARLNTDGTLDASFDPNANNVVAAIAVLADGKILIGGVFTTLSPNGGAAVPSDRIARMNADGSLDASFDPRANSNVLSIVVQADGKILIGGTFTSLSPNGSGAVARNRIARLNADGTLDATFAPNASNTVTVIVIQLDGKILIGGIFTTLSPNGGAAVTRNRIARLNADGAVDASFDPNANDTVFSITLQADGKILIGGIFTSLSPNGGAAVGRSCLARLNANATLDATFNPNADNEVDAIVEQADGKILIAGHFTSLSPNGGASLIRNQIARLNLDSTLDATIDPNTNEEVSATAVQPDGKILIGGVFTTLSPNGGPAVTRNHIARLNADGTLDATFDPNAGNNVNSIVVQADGRILIGGSFLSLAPNGGPTVTRNRIARLNRDGTLDPTFDPSANNLVYSLAVQPDGMILVAGGFTSLSPNGGATVTRNRVARLNADGTLDTSFNPNVGAIAVYTVTVQADGKILIGGAFGNISPNGGPTVRRNRMARLNADGTVDDAFDPDFENGDVVAIAVQADGKILAGGNFASLSPNGDAVVERGRIARLNADGTVDTSFDPNAGNTVHSIAEQSDGKILLSGFLTTLAPNGGATVTRSRIARINADGTVDPLFDPNVNTKVGAMVLEADGKIVIGGLFSTLSPNGGAAVTRNNLARLTNDTAALQNLAVTKNSVTWTRSGSSPLLTRVTFEYSTDSVSYSPLGDGTASGSNWTRAGLNLSTGQNIYIRARGYYRSGIRNASQSITESVRNAFLAGPTAAESNISGSISKPDGAPLAGAVVQLSGSQTRKVITDANGRYTFNHVETGGFYTVTPARANFNFNPFNRSFSQSGNRTEAAFTGRSMGDGANPLDTAEYFVRQQYNDVLGREPDEAGFNYWSEKILACGSDTQCVNSSRRAVAAAFFISHEYQASGAYIYDAYAGTLGRRPRFAEFTADRARVIGGATLDSEKTIFAENFVQRSEFTTKYQNALTAESFVDALIQSGQSSGVNLSGERANLISSYNLGTDLASSRAAAVKVLADNAAFKQSQYNQAFVLTAYFSYLRRDVDQSGYDFWVNVLNSSDNYRGMVCSFTTSAEYQKRFSTVVSHTNGECGN